MIQNWVKLFLKLNEEAKIYKYTKVFILILCPKEHFG